MREVKGDLKNFLKKGNTVCITTNSNVSTSGRAIMGKGIALIAKKLVPDLPKLLAKHKEYKQALPVVIMHNDVELISFPTKHNWWEQSDMELIKRSANYLQEWIRDMDKKVYLPKPGCGAGGLKWAAVKHELEKILDDRFIVVIHERNT